MYLAVPPQPDCVSAWREAVRAVDAKAGHVYYNVIIDVLNPTLRNSAADPVVAMVDRLRDTGGVEDFTQNRAEILHQGRGGEPYAQAGGA